VSTLLMIEKLVAGYSGSVVVRDLDLTVGAGEVVALLGANGAGKTTTLRAISGVVKSSSKELSFAGRDLATISPAARHRIGIAHVP
jgi:ABC-type branched-subunit amino acid transport system ATPase component